MGRTTTQAAHPFPTADKSLVTHHDKAVSAVNEVLQYTWTTSCLALRKSTRRQLLYLEELGHVAISLESGMTNDIGQGRPKREECPRRHDCLDRSVRSTHARL